MIYEKVYRIYTPRIINRQWGVNFVYFFLYKIHYEILPLVGFFLSKNTKISLKKYVFLARIYKK